MPNKRRCAGCKEYFDPGDMYVKGSVSAFCTQKCLRKKNVNKSRTPKRALPPALREAVKARDAYRCRLCLGREADHYKGWINLHHIYYRSEGGQNIPNNLISLCNECHNEVHSDKNRYKPLLIQAAVLAEGGVLVGVLDLEKQ